MECMAHFMGCVGVIEWKALLMEYRAYFWKWNFV